MTSEGSPRRKARLAGALYLISGQAFSFAEFSVRGKLFVPDDAAVTAHNILANETLYRLAVAAEVVPLYLVVTFILYDLLRPVNKGVSLLAFVFSIAGCTIAALNSLLHLAPLIVLKGFPSTSGFASDQRQGLALLFTQAERRGTQHAYGVFRMLLPSARLSHL
jgi:hypothetical protein